MHAEKLVIFQTYSIQWGIQDDVGKGYDIHSY